MDRTRRSAKSSPSALTLAAFGVVFGDIGTSPLYALRETFSPDYGMPLNSATVLGGVSTIFWALMIVVSVKYVLLMLRADNRGEGGIMALIALAAASVRDHGAWRVPLLLVGMFGAALFYGDAVLTPAISVLAAVEGLHVGTDAFDAYVMPLAVAVLLALFAFQRRGSAAVGRLFGPVMMLWFLVLGAGGLYGIARAPAILEALNPVHAAAFVTGHGAASFLVLGAVVLAVTGAEALYTDMGHFGKGPVRIAWFSLVAPALVLNYFGQGALIMAQPEAVKNPFYLLFPDWALYPMVGLATAATVIASQAVISGAYSLTRQAIQLGFLPRINVVHTSAAESGQVYMPAVNWLLCAVVVATVIGFGSSSRLAGAYGLAVTGTMLVDTLLTFFVVYFRWRHPLLIAAAATLFFLTVDLAFFAATLLKVADGGWFPLAIAAVLFTAMSTWRRGRELLLARLRASSVPLEPFLKSLFAEPLQRVPGTAVFLTATPEVTPNALLHNLNHNKVLHQRVVFLNVEIRDEPFVSAKERVTCQKLPDGCWRVRVHYGFLDRPDVTRALQQCRGAGLDLDMMETSFFLSREKIVPLTRGRGAMAMWRDRMFAAMARNAASITDFFNIPSNRVIELGTRVEI